MALRLTSDQRRQRRRYGGRLTRGDTGSEMGETKNEIICSARRAPSQSPERGRRNSEGNCPNVSLNSRAKRLGLLKPCSAAILASD
jgi:hypothetical protein